MRKIIFAIAALLLLSVVVAGGQTSLTSKAGLSITKGYLTVGNTVVVLPRQLKSGDELVFTNMLGVSVLRHWVGTGHFNVDASNLMTGFYVITLKRNGGTIAAIKVPLSI